MALNEKDIMKCVAKGLQISLKKINLNSSHKNINKWDSLGHLNILTELDNSLNGKALKLAGLAKAYSVKEIIKILKTHKLSK